MTTAALENQPRAVGHLREVHPEVATDVATVARLHLTLLGHGPMARLGELFLRKFCYTTLLRDGLLRVALYEVDGEPAGFVAYTAYSITFHRTAIRNHLLRVAYVTVLSILTKPTVLLRIPKAVHLMISRREEEGVVGRDPCAEVVAIGVLPAYRSSRFTRETGIKVSAEILEYVKAYFRRAGLSELRMIVEADNKPTLFFYHSMGATFEPYEQHGDPMAHVRFDLRAGVDPATDPPACWQTTEPPTATRTAQSPWDEYWSVAEVPRAVAYAQAKEFVDRLGAVVPLPPAMRVLDFGCGTGFVADMLADRVGEVSVWDASPRMRQLSRINLAHRGNVRFLDLRSAPADPRGTFDLIVANSVVQYMTPDDLSSWLLRWRGMLAPGGAILLADLIPPQHGSARDAWALMRFSPRAFWGIVTGALGRYLRFSRSASLLQLAPADLDALSRAAALTAERLPRNLTHFPGRFSALFTPAPGGGGRVADANPSAPS